jgi:hypothetical protein
MSQMKSGRRDKGAQHVRLYRWMTKRPVWLTMSPDAKAVFLHIYDRYNGANNGEVTYGIRCAAEIRVSKDRAARALKELLNRGFIRVKTDAWFNKKDKLAREWILTTERYADRPATKDFMGWPNLEHGRTSATIQSHQCDNPPVVANHSHVSVAPARLSAAKTAPSQSRQRDTSNIPSPLGRRPPRFGDAAKAERTARKRAPRSPGPFSHLLDDDEEGENFGEIANSTAEGERHG